MSDLVGNPAAQVSHDLPLFREADCKQGQIQLTFSEATVANFAAPAVNEDQPCNVGENKSDISLENQTDIFYLIHQSFETPAPTWPKIVGA